MSSSAHHKKKHSGAKQNEYVPQESKVNFLKRGQHYSESPKRIYHKETHMSWVFLTDVYAYKLKKALRLNYLDFSSLKKRKEDGEHEIKLNSKLAPDIYLRVIPLVIDNDHQLQLDGKGKTVDWLVKMRKLDEQFMLDELIRNNLAEEMKIKKAAENLAKFYQEQAAEEISSFDYWNKIMSGVKENYAELLDSSYQLPTDIIKEVITALQQFLTEDDQLLEERVNAGKVVEGHGDLRPEHICLEKKPIIFGRPAFNRDFRIIDPADELAFLSMECELLGNDEVGKWFVEIYQQMNEDRFSEKLFTFYKCNRACLRAKLAVQHLKESKYKNQKKWIERAQSYLHLANKYAANLN